MRGAEVKPVTRYTVALLPPEDVAAQIEAYARLPEFDDYAVAKDGTKLYRLGHEGDEHRKAHITSIQIECSEEDFIKVINFLRGQDFSKLKANMVNVDIFDIPADTASYPPAFPYPLKWIDRDVKRDEPLMTLNRKLVEFLDTLPTIARDAAGKPKTVNGVLDNYRPHFTLFKGNLGEEDSIPMPKYEGSTSFDLRIAVGVSKPTGELTAENVWGVFDAKGNYQAVKKELDFSAFDTLSYKAWSYADWGYRQLPSLSAYYQNMPSLRDIANRACDNVEHYTGYRPLNRL